MKRWASLLLGLLLAGCVSPPTQHPPDAPASIWSNTAVYPGNYAFPASYSSVLAPGMDKRLPDEVVDLKSNVDGADIRIGIARPDMPNGARVSVIAMLGDFYECTATDPGPPPRCNSFAPVPLEAGKLDHLYDRFANTDFLLPNFVPHGYAVALVAWRGVSGSGGCEDDLGLPTARDLDQAVTWLGTQPWSNGNVGTIGGSLSGGSQWAVAAQGNPHLKTIVAIDSVIDRFSTLNLNGTTSAFGYLSGPPTDSASAAAAYASSTCPQADQEANDAYAYEFATGERDPNGYLTQRDFRERALERYNGSILLTNGLQDPWIGHAWFPLVDAFREKGLVVKQIIGQWEHSYPDSSNPAVNPTRRFDWAETVLHWYDRWLKNDPTSDLGPPVEVADSQDQWRTEPTWPPGDATPRVLDLAPGGRLAENATEAGSVVLPPDPSWDANTSVVSDCASCATFDTAATQAPFRFAGQPQLHVTVTPAGSGGQLAAYLWLVQGSTRQLLTFTYMDLRFASGGEHAAPVVPGAPLLAKMQLLPVDAVVPPGAHLELVMGQTRRTEPDTADTFDGPASTPAVGPAPSRPLPAYTPFGAPPTTPIVLSLGPDSTITLDTFTRDGSTFFAPPEPSGGQR